MKPHEVTSQWWDHATLWNADDPHLGDAGHATDGGRVFGITRLRYDECDDYGCRPVVVISPEDREAVERLSALYVTKGIDLGYAMPERQHEDRRAALQQALREFAAPKPLRPDEPQGLGAVVEDADGKRWVLTEEPDMVWHCGGLLEFREWADIDVVRVLSEGVRP